MKKKITYELPCHRKAEDCEAPQKRRKPWKSLGAFLVLVMLFMLAVPEAKADIGKDELAKHRSTNHVKGFVEFAIPIRSTEGYWTSLKDPTYMKVGENKIFNIRSSANNFNVQMVSTHLGKVEVYTGSKWKFIDVSTWTTDEFVGTNEAPPDNSLQVYAYFRYYPPTTDSLAYELYLDVRKQDPGVDYTKSNKIITTGIDPSFDSTSSFTNTWAIKSIGKEALDITTNLAPSGNEGIKKIKWTDGQISGLTLKDGFLNASYGGYKLKISENEWDQPVQYIWVQDVNSKPLEVNAFSKNIKMPAYNMPKDLEISYNQQTGINSLTWNINLLGLNTKQYVKGDKFHFQRASDKNFTNDVQDFYVDFIDKENIETPYLLEDDIATISNKDSIYYRIRRTQTQDDWKWENCREISNKPRLTDHAKITTATATLDKTSSIATIAWADTTGYWSNNTKLFIEKRNGGNNIKETFELTKEDWKKGFYEDDAIASCVSYSYSVHIKPGNTIFPTQKAVNATGEVLISNVGDLLILKASKGYYPDRVSLQWNSKGKFDHFIVRRTLYGQKSDTVQVALVTASSSDLYTFDDDKSVAGTYYTYIIQGVMECGGKKTVAQTVLKEVGFRSPQGNIYGRVTYENGQSVEGVEIRLEQDGNNIVSGSSILFSENATRGLTVKNMSEAISNNDFTFQTWIKPTDASPKNQVLFSAIGQYEIGFDGNTELYLKQGNTELIKTPYKFNNNEFKHISVVCGVDSVFICAGDSVLNKVVVSATPTTPQRAFFLGSDSTGNAYKGRMDEVRIWNRALTYKEIEQNHKRLITGNEKDLIAYYRFDEIIDNAFYDISYKHDTYNENHGEIRDSIKHDSEIPDNEQLSLKGITNESGNYFINGVPYTGNGTQYKIIPRMGTHQFDPTHQTRFISGNSLSHEVIFKDKSSFPVSGYVYYTNSTVPVQGVMFKIDGVFANDGKGNVITTNNKGEFKISVPVGYHEVKAEKSNHKFEREGRITDSEGKDLNYQKPIIERVLRDTTTVRFIGRIAGGAIQEAYPLGHSLSTNNLGDDAKIEMELVKEGVFYNAKILNDHFKPKDYDKRPNSSRWKDRKTTGSIENNKITIIVDKKTGEFVVDLIPEKFRVTNVETKGHTGLLKNQIVIDLSEKLIEQEEVYAYKDSIEAEHKDVKYNYINYSDTIAFNDSYKFILRQTPTVEIKQLVGNKEVDYFGNDSISITNLLNEKTTMPVYDKNLKAYLLDNTPILTSGTVYGLKIRAFESYLYYNNNNEIKAEDKVPTTDGVVKINNSWRDGAVGIEEISLDGKGEGDYHFTTGAPEESGTVKTFGASIDFSGNSVPWNRGNNLKAYVLGSSAATGDFVTAGPNRLLAVLRDPPGSKSYAYLEKGTTFTSNTKTTETFHNDGKAETTAKLGLAVVTVTGIGFAVTNAVEQTNEIKTAFSHKEDREWGNITTRTTTISDQITTSDDPLYVGADGDLFIGNSTNISYGITNSILLIPDRYKKDDDIILAQGDSIALVKRKTLSTSTSFETMFIYPQIHIESVLIPNLIKLRNSLFANEDPSKIIYKSKLPITDPRYGASNNDDVIFEGVSKIIGVDGPSYTIKYPGNKVPETISDTIHSYNQKIQNWKNLLSKNEEAKLTASEKLNNQSNYSFHAGSKFEHSREYSFQNTGYDKFEYVLSGEVAGQIGFALNGAGVIVGISEEFGGGRIKETEDSKAETRKEGFVLAEEGSDYLSVDVFFEKNPDYEDYLNNEINKGEADYSRNGPFVYRTKGGVTSCPYEGGYISRYYKPGTVISEPTLRMEVPKISIDKNLVKNVSSNRKAVFKLFLEHKSESKEDIYYTLNLLDKSNPHGATLSIDGMPLGNNGRTILVTYGDIVEKTLEVARGPQEMNYNDLQLILASQCQYDPTDFLEDIADTVMFSAHFIPSCSEIQIKEPLNKWITNTSSKFDIDKKGYILPIVLNQFDVNNGSLERFEIQVKQEDESVWTTQRVFYLDPALAEGKSNAEIIDKSASEIKYDFVMDGMSDSRYDIRAVSICKVLNNEILTYSDIVSGTKDTQRPTLFGSVQPANGILDINTEVLLNFNEAIKEGALTRSNFMVTGIRNGSITDHGVSVLFDGVDNYIASEAERNLSDKDITIEMWVLRSATDAATLFSHGNVNESIEFGFNANNRLEVKVGASAIESSPLTIAAGQWAHIAMVYKAETQTVSAYYNFVKVINNSEVANYKGQGNWELGRSIKQGGQYFAGQMHEVRVWTKERSSGDLQINSLKTLTGLEAGLLIYYPMSEGKGKVVFDKARGANGAIWGEWKTPTGKAIALDGTSSLKIASGSTIAIDSEMDYTLEFWFKADKNQTDVALITNELTQDGQEFVENRFYVGFNNFGKLVFRSDGNETIVEGKNRQDYRDNGWHHFAASINRIFQKTEIYVDEEMICQLRTDNVGGIGSDYITVGAKRSLEAMNSESFGKHFKGSIDEIRVWNTSLNEKLISKNSNIRLSGQEMGLLAYYPFEEWIDFQNGKELKYTLKDMKVQKDTAIVVPAAIASNSLKEVNNTAPIKDRGPVENLSYSYVVSDKSLLIHMEEVPEVIEKSTVTFSVDGVQDMFGNKIKSPITWSAYIDRNLLKWSEDQLNLTMKEFKSTEFKVDIINNGGKTEKYSIENLPKWLTATPDAATINPKSKQTVVFTIDEGLNVGSYSEVIYMLNSNNVTEALPLNVKVESEKPNWSVDPAKFEYNMSVYGQLRVNNIFSKDKEDIIAAFVNNECVGLVNNAYHTQSARWFTFLTVYGNKTNENAPIEFRIWDASTGKTFAATTTEPITFKNQQIYGTSSNPLIFDTNELYFQNFKLNKGWNWISFNVSNSTLSSVQSTLGRDWKSADIVKNENHFDSYSVNSKEWIGTLSAGNGFNNNSLYMLKSTDGKSLSVVGSALDLKTTAINITGKKWNYISYLPTVNMRVDEALVDYDALDGDVIKSQESFAMFNGSHWVGSLNYLEPNKGYMLRRVGADNVSFKYPTIQGSLRSVRSEAGDNLIYRNYNHENNMTVVAEVKGGINLRSNDRILAYLNGELRGRSIVEIGTLNELHFINVVSDEAGTVKFAVERNGEIIAKANNAINYGVNHVEGSIDSPLALNFDVSVENVSVYPNPFKSVLKINVSLEKESNVEILIHNVNGSLMKSWKPSMLNAGQHEHLWNADAMSAGVYIIFVKIDGDISTFKVIKQ